MSAAKKISTIPCATCGQPTSYFTDPTGPFCSRRCQMVDLGHWINEDYRISEPLRPDHFAQYEDAEQGELDRPEEEG